ncbi:MAG: formyltransferase family protein [Rhodospirillales bacterium]|nr:formyltransferase family protein [Rhodospirillales bacterium]
MTKSKLILFGGNRLNEDGPLLPFAKEAAANGVDVLIVTERWHLDMKTANGESLSQRLEFEGLAYRELEALSANSLAEDAPPDAWGLMVNCLWIVKKDIIDLFGGRLFNYHNARLPEERGAAAYSWRILSGITDGSLTIHHVTENLDDGDILLARDISFPESCQTPAAHYQFMAPLETEIFGEFLDVMLSGEYPDLKPQDESLSRYWPRLKTDVHGYIDWQWSADAVCRFIRAFDDPFTGAMTFWQDTRLHLKGASIDPGADNFHPFQAGMVFRKSEEGLNIAVPGGAVIVTNVTDDDSQSLYDRIPLGTRLYTPNENLNAARATRAIQRHNRIDTK